MKKGVKLGIGITLVVTLTVGGFWLKNLFQQSSQLPGNEYSGAVVLPLEKQDMSEYINVTGTIESQNVYCVTSELPYVIKEIMVSEGEYVEVGQTLCVIDDTEIRERIMELEAQADTVEMELAMQKQIAARTLEQAKESQETEVNKAYLAMEVAETEYTEAVDNHQKAKEYYFAIQEDENIGEEEILMAYETMEAMKEIQLEMETIYNGCKANYDEIVRTNTQLVQSAQDAYDLSNASIGKENGTSSELAKLYRELESTKIVAKQSGIITAINVSVGSIPTDVLIQIEDNKNLKVVLNLAEKDVVKLKEGMDVIISTDAFPDLKWDGRVERVINYIPSNVSGINMESSSGFGAEISIFNSEQLLLGMKVKTKICVVKQESIVAVPYSSVVKNADESAYVYRVVPTDKQEEWMVEKITIKTGIEGKMYTEIISEELNEGDLIACYPEMLKEGDIVSIYRPDMDMN